jgi:hypothetical protein
MFLHYISILNKNIISIGVPLKKNYSILFPFNIYIGHEKACVIVPFHVIFWKKLENKKIWKIFLGIYIYILKA